MLAGKATFEPLSGETRRGRFTMDVKVKTKPKKGLQMSQKLYNCCLNDRDETATRLRVRWNQWVQCMAPTVNNFFFFKV